MKERPILFKGEMVRAILEGRKTQTRRIVKLRNRETIGAFWDHGAYEPFFSMAPSQSWVFRYKGSDRSMMAALGSPSWKCPYGIPGDRLWVRETWNPEPSKPWKASYRASWRDELPPEEGWKPSIHMPRWASRINLEVTGVRVERLKEITEADAKLEGVDSSPFWKINEGICHRRSLDRRPKAIQRFHELWQSINGLESWNANPWVWVVEFRKI